MTTCTDCIFYGFCDKTTPCDKPTTEYDVNPTELH